jgi:CubicO group peptidase (beta-lactamase class C family)
VGSAVASGAVSTTFGSGRRSIEAVSEPRPLGGGTHVDLGETAVVPRAGAPSTAADVLRRWDTRSLVVTCGGELAIEWIADGHDVGRPQRCYSVTKSMTGTLLAELVVSGAVSRADRVGDVVPDLASSGFGDATVGDLADMTLELAYVEDYAEIAGGTSRRSGHDFGDYVVALGMEDPTAVVDDTAARSIRDLLPRIGRSHGAHGAAFHYATPVTDVIGWVIESVTGRDVPELFTEMIWNPSRPESAAGWGTDQAGTPSVGAGLELTTRDLARIGMMLSERARGEGPVDAVSEAALAEVRRGGSTDVFAADGHYAYLGPYSYRDQWWIPSGPHGPISGWGIYGQFLWIDPDRDVVIACHGRDREPSDASRDLDQHALCVALTEALTT